MKRRIAGSALTSVVLPVLLLFLWSSARAGDEAESLLKQLSKKYDTINDATVSFTQHVLFGVTKVEQTFGGTLIMKKGNKYRIELEDQTTVTDGKSVWTYVKSNKQVFLDTYKDNPRSFSPDKVLVNVSERYHAIILGQEKIGGVGTTILKLIPIDAKSNIQWMKVWVDEDHLMKRIEVLDVSDNLRTYSVDTMKTNTGVNEGQFQFTVPQGVEVVDLR